MLWLQTHLHVTAISYADEAELRELWEQYLRLMYCSSDNLPTKLLRSKEELQWGWWLDAGSNCFTTALQQVRELQQHASMTCWAGLHAMPPPMFNCPVKKRWDVCLAIEASSQAFQHALHASPNVCQLRLLCKQEPSPPIVCAAHTLLILCSSCTLLPCLSGRYRDF